MSALNHHSTEEIPLLNDGRFLVIAVLSTAYEDEESPVFMHALDQIGDNSVGTCLPQHDGTWEARISVLYDDDSNSDSLLVGRFDQRMDAIVSMWQRRFEAMSTNP